MIAAICVICGFWLPELSGMGGLGLYGSLLVGTPEDVVFAMLVLAPDVVVALPVVAVVGTVPAAAAAAISAVWGGCCCCEGSVPSVVVSWRDSL